MGVLYYVEQSRCELFAIQEIRGNAKAHRQAVLGQSLVGRPTWPHRTDREA